ncbi:uncharacterized protein LOC135503204 [Lineus longissimus]|uniref:uncharacterized protein LOC135503204 n=1 Tax=Lineus longissimus TaxID=88925 RepID=UPI002B4DBBA7
MQLPTKMKPFLYIRLFLVFVSTASTESSNLAYPDIIEEDIVGMPQIIAAPLPGDISPQRFEYSVFIDCMQEYGKKVVALDKAKNLFKNCGSLECLDSKGTFYKFCALYSYSIDHSHETISQNFFSNKDAFFKCLYPNTQLLQKRQENELLFLINAYTMSIFFCKEDYSCLREVFSNIGQARFNGCWLDCFGGSCTSHGGICVRKKKGCRKAYPKANGCGSNFCCRVEFNHQCKCHYGGVSESGNVSITVTDWCIPWEKCVSRFNKYQQVQ